MPSSIGVTPHNDNAHLTSAKRSGVSGVAGLYACQTLIHKHINPAMESYDISHNVSSYGTTNVNSGDGGTTNLSSPARMQVYSGVQDGANCRIVIPQHYPVTANFIEVSCLIHDQVDGAGGDLRTFIGLRNSWAYSSFAVGSQFIGFYKDSSGDWYRGTYSGTGGSASTDMGSLGRDPQDGDMLTVRLYRSEGAADIDSYAMYVNGLRITYQEGVSSIIPSAPLYPGFGVYNHAGAGIATSDRSMDIRRFAFRYIP